MMLYLKHVRIKDKAINTVRPEDYTEEIEDSHSGFTVVNLQNVLDGEFLKYGDELDDGITSDMMYELECDVMGENRKCIPYFVKYLLMLFMLLGIVGNLFFVTIIGGQLPPLMLKEWLLYLICSVVMYGFGLLPLLAVIVGIVPYVKLKVKRI
jgi:hypothetical protein